MPDDLFKNLSKFDKINFRIARVQLWFGFHNKKLCCEHFHKCKKLDMKSSSSFLPTQQFFAKISM